MTCPEPGTATLYVGEDKDLILRLILCPSKIPYDLSVIGGGDELTAKFKAADGTCLEKKLSLSEIEILSAIAGQIKVKLTAADTILLEPGEKKSFEVEIFNDSKTRVSLFNKKLNVLTRVC